MSSPIYPLNPTPRFTKNELGNGTNYEESVSFSTSTRAMFVRGDGGKMYLENRVKSRRNQEISDSIVCRHPKNVEGLFRIIIHV